MLPDCALLPSPRHGSATYAEIAGRTGYLARCESFEGEGMCAGWGDADTFVVYSHATPIAAVRRSLGVVVFDQSRYGMASRRHQALTRAWLGRAVEWLADVESELGDGTEPVLEAQPASEAA